ncbi:MAG TPA: thioredoxin family protein [Candidatus Glassbacteria bacterium]|nr:thioredoxin family protein [Candidatus Glassbacteria bacterium]
MPEDKKNFLIKDLTKRVKNFVKIIMFTQELECKFCSDTKKLVKEVGDLNDTITVQIYDFMKNKDIADKYNVNKIPSIVIEGAKDYGVRIYGIPYGYELSTLIEAIVNVSNGTTDLSDKTKSILTEVKNSVHIQVFVSLTCPHCPIAAAVAHKLAIESDLVRADVIDINEFPELSQKYDVISVPKIIINEKIEFVGAFSEDLFAEHVLLGTF